MILGNKVDMTEQRVVSFDEASSFANGLGKVGCGPVTFYDVSAKENFNVYEAFISLARQIKDSGLLQNVAEQQQHQTGAEAATDRSTPVQLEPVGYSTHTDGQDLCSGCGGGGGELVVLQIQRRGSLYRQRHASKQR